MATLVYQLLALLSAIALARGGGGGYGRLGDWSYEWDATVQGNWSYHEQNAACADSNTAHQSPINIQSRDTVYHSMELKTNNYDDTHDVYFEMSNGGSAIGFVAKNDAGSIPQTVEFKGTTYRLYQFHFHWGSNLYQGSEHEVDSQRFPAELHIIHYNTKYASVSEAIAQDDGLLVWGHFLKADSRNGSGNEQLQKLLNEFSKVKSTNATPVKVEDVNLRKLIPEHSNDFYHYSGSLTTPPCYESVQWIVNRNPIHVSESQIAVFRTLNDEPMELNETVPHGGDNFRPPQPLHGRLVERNFNDDKKCDDPENRRRRFCGKEFPFRSMEGEDTYYTSKLFMEFRPNAPKLRDAKYDNRTDCLILELEPEDTGNCALRYSFEYKWNSTKHLKGEFRGTKRDLEGVRIKSCWNSTMYNSDATITVGAMHAISAEENFSDKTTEAVVLFNSEDPTKCNNPL